MKSRIAGFVFASLMLIGCAFLPSCRTNRQDYNGSATVEVNGECIFLESNDSELIVPRGADVDVRDYLTISPSNCEITVVPQTSNIQVVGTRVLGLSVGEFSVAVTAGANKRLIIVTGNVVEKICDTLSISNELNTELNVWDELDISSYVSVTPLDCEWHLVAITDNVTISGKTIIANKAGDFRVRVIAGSNEVTKTVSGVIKPVDVSALNDALALIAKDNNYTAVLQNEDGILSVAWHDSSYFGNLTFDDSGNPIVDGLLALNSGKTAEYTISGNLNLNETTMLPSGGKFEVEPGYLGPLDLYPMGRVIEVTGNDFTPDDEHGDKIVLDEKTLNAWAPTMVGVFIDSLDNDSSSTITNIYATLYENGDISLELTTNSNKKIANLDIKNIGSTSIAEVEAYIKAGTEPEQLKFEAFNALMTKGIEEKNYALKGTLEIGYYDDSKVWNTLTNANALSSLREDWGIEPASFQAYVDGETYYSINDNSKAISGYTKKGDIFYCIGGTYDAKTASYEWETAANQEHRSIWEIGLSTTQEGYTSHAAFAIGDYTEELLGSINWASVTTDKDGNVKATATPYGDEGHALALGMALVPQIGNSYAWMMSTLSSKAYPSAHWYDFFDRQEYVYNKADNSITINTTLDYIASSGGVYYGVRFIVEIGSVGTTTLPSGFPGCSFQIK